MGETHNLRGYANYRFTDIFDLHEIQKLQDLFSAATGVASLITEPDGTPITSPSGFSSLCNEIRKTEVGLRNCMTSDCIIGSPNIGRPIIQTCFSGGLIDGGVSIMVEGKHIANWLVGQVVDEDYNLEDLLLYADVIGLNREFYQKELMKVKRMSRLQFESVCNFLFINVQQLSKYANNNRSLAFEINERVIRELEINQLNNELENRVVERTRQLEESNCELEETNAMLEEEIFEHQKAEDEIIKLNEELEKRVAERTIQLEESNCELEETNAVLEEEIFERQKVEEEILKLNAVLDKSNTLLSSILESSPEIIVFTLDNNYRYLAFNERHRETMLQIWGKEIEIGMNMLEVIGEQADYHKAKDNFDRVLAGESFTLIEEYGDEKHARLFWQDYWSPIYTKDGKVIGITCFVINITDQKRAEEVLKERDRLLNESQKVAHIGSYETDLKTRVWVGSPELNDIFGIDVTYPCTVEGWVGIVHSDWRTRLINHLFEVETEKKRFDYEYKITRINDGQERWVHGLGELEMDDQWNAVRLIGTIQDITDRKLSEEALRENESRQKTMISNISDVIGIMDQDGIIRYTSPNVQKLFGWLPEELLGTDARATVHPADLERIKDDLLLNLTQFNNTRTVEFRFKCKNGSYCMIELTAINLIKEHTIKGILINYHDITERKKAEEEIIRAKEQAESANAAKGQFLANMSHEIRTPMNGILGMTDLTLMTDLKDQQREYLSIVKSSTIALLGVLNDILDYTKIEAGVIDLTILPFDLRITIHEVIDLFDISAKQKALPLKLEFDQSIPKIIIGDSVRLRQVLSNLLGNGIKFTSQGQIQIKVNVEHQDDNNIKLRFTVTDTGIGIPKDKVQMLFKRFSQLDNSNTRQFGGTGLGLAISKNLVEMMGGEIGVESQEGVGSSFFFSVVFGLQEKSPESPLERAQITQNVACQEEKSDRKKVLLVEDDLVSRKMVTIVLENEGYEVIAVVNGLEAVSAYEREKFHLILMDINMPFMDGYSATAVIRQKERDQRSHTPIIAMTAYALKGDQEKCLEAGMDDYLTKPINLEEVLEKIQKYINQ